MHSNSLWMVQRFADLSLLAGRHVLEVGPTGRPSAFREAAPDVASWETVGLEASPAVDVVAEDPYHYPFPDARFDAVLAANVLEHVPRPWAWLEELHRITVPGGRLILVLPVSWPFHQYPVDCWRAYPDGLRALLADFGWEPVVCEWGSIEGERFPRHLPGRAAGWWLGRPWARLYRIAGRLGLVRVECAYDTVAVAERAS